MLNKTLIRSSFVTVICVLALLLLAYTGGVSVADDEDLTPAPTDTPRIGPTPTPPPITNAPDTTLTPTPTPGPEIPEGGSVLLLASGLATAAGYVGLQRLRKFRRASHRKEG